MVMRHNGVQYALATQSLPLGLHGEQKEAAVRSFASEVHGGHIQRPLRKGTFKWREFRQPTKNVLMAMVNGLQQALPDSWSLKDCQPQNLLVPRGVHSERFTLEKEEKQALGLPRSFEKMSLKYHWDFERRVATPDFYVNEHHWKLVFAADEGTEVQRYQKVKLMDGT